jgi:hypothetical protein
MAYWTEHVKDVKSCIQTYKLVTLDGTVSRFIYVISVTDQNDPYQVYKSQFVPHRKHITSPLQSPTGECCLGK